MNWNKGINTLIILFLSINILLGWVNYRKDSSAYTLKEAQVEDIKVVLAENNIFAHSPIPKKHRPLPKLAVSPFQLNSAAREDFVKKLLQTLDGVTISIEAAKSPNEKPRRIYRKGEEVVVFEGENVLYYNEANRGQEPASIEQGQKAADKWLSKIDYAPRKMHRQIVEEADGLYVIYYDKFDGIPVFDSYVKIKLTRSGVKEAQIHKVERGEVIGERQEIYSADQVLFSMIKLIGKDKPTHIKNIMIGYALENPKGTHLIAEKALPFYQIILEDGKTYYINAYNSEIRGEPQI